MRTTAQRTGDDAEALVESRLAAVGWTILARRLRVGRAELDLVAVDPGPPARLVAVEVRWRSRRDFGTAEESVDRRKVARLRTAIARLAGIASLPDGQALPRLPPAVDLVVVEPPAFAGGAPRLRHHRDAFGG